MIWQFASCVNNGKNSKYLQTVGAGLIGHLHILDGRQSLELRQAELIIHRVVERCWQKKRSKVSQPGEGEVHTAAINVGPVHRYYPRC